MSCQRCQSERIASVSGKCSDMCTASVGDSEMNGPCPDDLGVGGGDYIEIQFCLNCGQLQGKFPLPPSEMEKDISDDEVAEFFDNHFVEGQKIGNIPRRQQWQLIDSSANLSAPFRSFMKDFFDWNGDMYSTARFPSVEKFVQMFRSKNAELENAENNG